MENKKTQYLIWAAMVILVLIAGYFGVKLPIPPQPEPVGAQAALAGGGLSIYKIGNPVLMGQTLGVTGNTSVGGTLGVTGATTLASTLDVTGVTTVAANAALNGGITVDTSNFTVNGTTGAVSTASTLAVGGIAQISGDLTLPADATGGNAGAKTEISGLPRIKMAALGTMTNGITETTSYMDDSPAGEYAPVDADVTESEDAVTYRVGSASYKAAFAASASSGDGFKRTITGDNLEANESIGCWFYPSVAIASGDLQILLTDDGGARNFNIGALDANKWTWSEIDISSLAAGTGDVVTEFGVTLTAQGATAQGAFNLYTDGCWKWDAADEEDLAANILQDGVIGVWTVATAAGSPNTQALLVEGTDYFVNYQTSNDVIVVVTDQSSNSGVAWVAY